MILLMTEQMFGVRAVDVQCVRKQGNRLFYDRDGKDTPIHRIYNRVIADELERRHLRLPFDYRDDLDVEWAGHPNWFFRLSKFSMPYLDHPAAPWTQFLDRVGQDRASRTVRIEAAIFFRRSRGGCRTHGRADPGHP